MIGEEDGQRQLRMNRVADPLEYSSHAMFKSKEIVR